MAATRFHNRRNQAIALIESWLTPLRRENFCAERARWPILGLDGGGQECPPYTNEHLGLGKGAEILRWQGFALRRPALPQDDGVNHFATPTSRKARDVGHPGFADHEGFISRCCSLSR
jgi:hypothetical protein